MVRPLFQIYLIEGFPQMTNNPFELSDQRLENNEMRRGDIGIVEIVVDQTNEIRFICMSGFNFRNKTTNI